MIHLYCGDGKGKTTAAVGLAVRAAGAGMKVYFYQFLKNGCSSEIPVIKSIDGITVNCCENCNKFIFEMSDDEKAAVIERHNEMLSEIKSLIDNSSADLIILDEFFGAYNFRFLDCSAADKLVLGCPDNIELVLTGRNPSQIFCDAADYYSDIKALKHPYEKGISARKGIEY